MSKQYFGVQSFRTALGLTLFLVLSSSVRAQRVGLKSNALYWAAMSPNLGAEFRVNRHLTLNAEATGSLLQAGGFRTRALSFCPEARYWFSARPQAGHFVGLVAMASTYNVLLNGARHKGDAFGGGLTYGYSFVLGRHWSLEATAGVGALHINEKKFREGTEDVPDHANNAKWIPAPIKAGVTFVYLIK
ncbi:MAG TPA: DUF3575 domain-containing protein [Prevotellaceae bacterium]|nr:DUF3575 domain-containing protein [Prevotellaceae bacterium]HBE55919.1 DUF3575 domain-containing protein [Prevotellaceae bacterium]